MEKMMKKKDKLRPTLRQVTRRMMEDSGDTVWDRDGVGGACPIRSVKARSRGCPQRQCPDLDDSHKPHNPPREALFLLSCCSGNTLS
mmetsp:Transcript_23736/g.35853  ORF Transcript_23736/g.35853 Transcript_23736/m.35853 type:complete len:87 (-) Transcript_23736:161-421(-)